MAKNIKVAKEQQFPEQACREAVARKYGEDAVALSGPFEGERLTDAVCKQISGQWDEVKGRLAKKELVGALAVRLAKSFCQKDDTADCINDIEKAGYEKTAAAGIADYMKAFAVDKTAFDFTNEMADDVKAEDELANEEDAAEVSELETEEEEEEKPHFPGESSEEHAEHEANETPEQEAAEHAMGESESEENEETVDFDVSGIGGEEKELGTELGNELGGLEGAEAPVTIEIPAEVAEEIMNALQVQLNETPDSEMPGEEKVLGDVGAPEALEISVDTEPAPEAETDVEVSPEPEVSPEVVTPEIGAPGSIPGKPEEKQEGKQLAESCGTCASSDNKMEREAAMGLKAGHIKKAGQVILQLAANKDVEAPKPISEGNKVSEGFGDGKVQDGSTLGKEQKFDAKEVSKESVSGGSASLIGKDEAFPEGKAQVPSENAYLGTKGTIIARIENDGLRIITPDGKKYVAKLAIKNVTEAVAQEIGQVAFEGDVKKFANAIVKILRKAECCDCCTTDTSKKESESFQNLDIEKEKKYKDGEKKDPNEGAAKTDTSKKESKDFQNDSEKKAEAASAQTQKTAADKKIEEPTTVEEKVQKQDGKVSAPAASTIGKEETFKAVEVKESDVSENKAKLETPSVPAQEADLSTKGTVIAGAQSQKSEADLRKQLEAESKIQQARLVAAGAYAADLLRHGDIGEEEYATTVEKTATMSVQAIQQLALSARKMRERIAAQNPAPKADCEVKVAGMGIPLMLSKNEKPLVERLVEQMKLTRNLNAFDEMKK